VYSDNIGDWRVVGTADLNDDNIPDILLQNTTTTWVAGWLMNGAGQASSFVPVYFDAVGDWRVVGAADLNGDDIPDVLLQNIRTTWVAAWLMNGAGQASSFVPVYFGDVGGWRVNGRGHSGGVPASFNKIAPAQGANGQSTVVSLSWQAAAGATLHEYCVDTTNNNSCDATWSLAPLLTNESIGGLSGATTFYWQVRARNAAGTTEANGGAWWSFTTAAAVPATFVKIAPTNGATGQSTSVTLSWEGSPSATNYLYCYDTTNNNFCEGPWRFAPVPTATSAAIGGLSTATTYYWQVRALSDAGTTEANGGVWWSFTTAALVPATVRVLYVMPQDRVFRSDFYTAVQNAMVSLQTWYSGQLSGKTFTLFAPQPEICQLPRPADYYAIDSWSKILADVQACAPVTYGPSSFAWVLYVDVVHACNAPGRLGAGAVGLTMLPRQDMDGLIGAPVFDDCGTQYFLGPNRYIGGAGHELGHAFGLPHPPGCDAGLPTCDFNALMWAGYSFYPGTYLRPEEKQFLLATPFFH
jgi:hypothetical protein